MTVTLSCPDFFFSRDSLSVETCIGVYRKATVGRISRGLNQQKFNGNSISWYFARNHYCIYKCDGTFWSESALERAWRSSKTVKRRCKDRETWARRSKGRTKKRWKRRWVKSVLQCAVKLRERGNGRWQRGSFLTFQFSSTFLSYLFPKFLATSRFKRSQLVNRVWFACRQVISGKILTVFEKVIVISLDSLRSIETIWYHSGVL